MNNLEKFAKTKKFSKKRLWIIIPLLLLFPILFLNNTGFCYSEMKYLSERQLIDRYLFGRMGAEGTDGEKITLLEQRNSDDRYLDKIEEYPACCRVTGQVQRSSILDRVLNNSFGFFLYQLEMSSVRLDIGVLNGDSDPSYYKSYASINACGLGSPYSYGSPESEESYHFDIQRNLKHWKE